jgi:hypothetical protein
MANASPNFILTGISGVAIVRGVLTLTGVMGTKRIVNL